QGAVGILKDDLHLPPHRAQLGRRSGREILALEEDRPARGLLELEDTTPGGRLAAARFADETESLAAADGERNVVHRLHHATPAAQKSPGDLEVLGEVPDGEDLLPAGRLLARSIVAGHRGHAHAVTFCLSSAETQHAETWPGDTASSGGASRRQRSIASCQPRSNAHP